MLNCAIIFSHFTNISFTYSLSLFTAFNCDTEKGFVFDECGPVCDRTCENFQAPLGDLKGHCYKPCVASCQCPANKVLYNGRCVDSSECPDIVRKLT